jgi:hypothetical protein
MSNSDSEVIESSVLKLQSLQTEFGLVMTQYKQAYANYISNVQATGTSADSGSSGSTTAFTTLQGRTFWGAAGISDSAATSVEECQALCSSDSTCTGATFNSEKQQCFTRSGQGDVAVGEDNEYAIVPELAQNAQVLQMLNQKLMDLNAKISDTLNTMTEPSKNNTTAANSQNDELKSIYNSLLAERKNIDKMLNDYTTLNEAVSDQSIYVLQNNTAYMFWFLVALIIVIFTLKIQFFPELRTNFTKIVFWGITAILFITLMMQLNTPTGYFLWLSLVAIIILIQMGVFPKP